MLHQASVCCSSANTKERREGQNKVEKEGEVEVSVKSIQSKSRRYL